MLTKEQEHKAQMKILEQMRIDLEKAQALENHKKAQEGMRKYCIPYRICLDYYKAPFNDEVVRLNPCYPLPGYEIDKCIRVSSNDFEPKQRADNRPLKLDEIFSVDTIKEEKRAEVIRVISECKPWVMFDNEWERIFLHFLKGYEVDKFTEFDLFGTKGEIHPGDIGLLRHVYKRLQKKYLDNPNDFIQNEPLLSDYDPDLYNSEPYIIVWNDAELEEQRQLERKMRIGGYPSTLPVNYEELAKDLGEE